MKSGTNGLVYFCPFNVAECVWDPLCPFNAGGAVDCIILSLGVGFSGRAGGSSNDILPSIEGAKTIRVTECPDKNRQSLVITNTNMKKESHTQQ